MAKDYNASGRRPDYLYQTLCPLAFGRINFKGGARLLPTAKAGGVSAAHIVMKFIKTEAGSLVNVDYIRIVYVDREIHRPVLIAEMDNGDHYILAALNKTDKLDKSVDKLFEKLNAEELK